MASEQDLSRRIKQLFRQPLDELTQQLPEPRSQKVRERVTQNRRTKGGKPVHPFKIIVENRIDYSYRYRPNNRGPDKDLSSSPDYGFVALENLGPGPSDRAIAADVYSGQSTTSLYDFKGKEFSAAIPTDASLSYLGYGFSATRGRFTKVSASYQSPYTFTNSNPGASTEHVGNAGPGYGISASGCIDLPNGNCDPDRATYIALDTFPKADCGRWRAATGAVISVSTPSNLEPASISETRNYVFGSSEDLISSSGQYHYFKDKSVSGGSYAPVETGGEGGDASFTAPSSAISYGTTDSYSYTTRAKNHFLNKGSLSGHQGTYEQSKTDDSTGGSSSKVGSSLAVSVIAVQFEYGVIFTSCGTGFIISSTSYGSSSTTDTPSSLSYSYSESGSVDVQLSPSLTLPYTESKLNIISGPEGGAYTQNSSSASKNQSHSIAVYNYKGVEACFYSVFTSSSSSSLNTPPTSESNNQYYLWVNGTIYEISDSLANGTYENNQYEPGLSSLTRDYYTTWVMFNSPQGSKRKIGTFYKAEPIWKDDDSIVEAKVVVYDLIDSGGISLVRRDKEPKYKLKIKPGEYPCAIKFYPQAGTIR